MPVVPRPYAPCVNDKLSPEYLRDMISLVTAIYLWTLKCRGHLESSKIASGTSITFSGALLTPLRLESPSTSGRHRDGEACHFSVDGSVCVVRRKEHTIGSSAN